MTKSQICVAAGHICLDIIPDLLDQSGFLAAIQPGHLLAIGPPAMSPGGSVSNTGLALQKLGMPTRLMGKIGSDPFGRELRDLLGAVDPALVAGMKSAANADTSYSIILSPADNDRVFLHSSAANDTFCAADVDYEQVAEAGLFHFGYPTLMAAMLEDNGRELHTMLQRAKALGVTTSLDMSMFDRRGPAGRVNWPLLLQRILPYVDVFLPSLDELLLMLNPSQTTALMEPDSVARLGEQLLSWGAQIVVIKLGARGLYMRTTAGLANLGGAFDRHNTPDWTARELWAPAFVADVVGTTGAGDCAVAGFLAAILREQPPEQALLMAAAVGACNVEAGDATSGVRPWQETVDRVSAGWPQHALALPGWQVSKLQGLWLGPNDRTRA